MYNKTLLQRAPYFKTEKAHKTRGLFVNTHAYKVKNSTQGECQIGTIVPI